MTRVLLVASSPAVRAGLAALLSGHSGLTVLESGTTPGRVGSSLDLVEADVMVVALEPGEEAPLPLRALPDTAARLPRVVLLGDEPTSGWATRALRNGAQGALPRTATADQILAAVMAVAAGLTVREAPDGNTLQTRALLPTQAHPALTGREVEILGLLAEGLGNKTIAARLGISEHTVKTHVTSVFAKLGVSTRAEAVANAIRLGLIML
ncbi:MAG TPA: response regulator transcription factor [Gemmatimonadales bacterium]